MRTDVKKRIASFTKQAEPKESASDIAEQVMKTVLDQDGGWEDFQRQLQEMTHFKQEAVNYLKSYLQDGSFKIEFEKMRNQRSEQGLGAKFT